jgi:hypothetical protein
MGNKNFKRLAICATLGLLSFGGLCATAWARGRTLTPNPTPDRIRIVSAVEVHKADGSVVLAECLGEIFLYPNGRANGAFGLLELGDTNPVPMVYRIVDAQVSSDNVYTFSAERLSLPQGPVIITLQPLGNSKSPLGSEGSVTFVDTTVGTFSFIAHFDVQQMPLGSSRDSNFAYINAPPQTVVVETLRGSYVARFENVALICPDGNAIGFLTLTPEDATPGGIQVAALWEIIGGRLLGREGKYLVLRPRPQERSGSNLPQPWFSIGPAPDPGTTDQHSYDLFTSRPSSGVLKFEAQANITIF